MCMQFHKDSGCIRLDDISLDNEILITIILNNKKMKNFRLKFVSRKLLCFVL